MNDISVKLLDTLFDLCEGESYVIVERDELTSRITYHTFAVDELTELLEGLSVEGFIDLKYADNKVFCVAMTTKGRTLIKQARERMQRMAESVPPAEDRGEEGAAETHPESPSLDIPDQDLLSEDPILPIREASSHHGRRTTLSDVDYSDLENRGSVAPNLARGYAVQASMEAAEDKSKRRERKMILAAALGAAAGSLLMNLIFLVVFLMKFSGKG